MGRTEPSVELLGRVVLRGDINVVTGLHIGGSGGAIAIGGVDMPVIRDVVNNRPYIPGSSLRGKMRSLSEKHSGAQQNKPLGQNVTIHVCKTAADYENCPVCKIFGVPATEGMGLTRLVVRDVKLSEESAAELEKAKTDLPYTEVKTEASIDRVTSAASPRQIERVPAGAVFSPMELVYSIYEPGDVDNFVRVVEALQLVEDDYLGGLGSRGGGKVEFRNLKLIMKPRGRYSEPETSLDKKEYANLQQMLDDLNTIPGWVRSGLAEG